MPTQPIICVSKLKENFGVDDHQGPPEWLQDKNAQAKGRGGQMLITSEKWLLYACVFWKKLWIYMQNIEFQQEFFHTQCVQ